MIRAEEHLSNTPRQIFMLEGLGYPRPEYAPPAVRRRAGQQEQAEQAEDRAVPEEPRLQEGLRPRRRRSPTASGWPTAPETFNPVIVDFYEQVGYLPDAILNYLLLLGWSLDDKTEFFTRDGDDRSCSRWSSVNKAPASFDVKKLFAFQERYMRRCRSRRRSRWCCRSS